MSLTLTRSCTKRNESDKYLVFIKWTIALVFVFLENEVRTNKQEMRFSLLFQHRHSKEKHQLVRNISLVRFFSVKFS